VDYLAMLYKQETQAQRKKPPEGGPFETAKS
jgi:hypothetical protein